jgi:predicted ArsR family transcriptional regulator
MTMEADLQTCAKAPYGTLRARMWRAMRILRSFTIEEIAAASGARPYWAKTYLLDLARQGYVRRAMTVKGPSRGRPRIVFAIARDDGARVPFGFEGHQSRRMSGGAG